MSLCVALALWFVPAAVALKRAKRDGSAAWLVHRAPSLADSIQAVRPEGPAPSYFLIMVASNEGLCLSSPLGTRIAEVPWTSSPSIELGATHTTRRLPTIQIVSRRGEAREFIEVLGSRPGWEFFPMVDEDGLVEIVNDLRELRPGIV